MSGATPMDPVRSSGRTVFRALVAAAVVVCCCHGLLHLTWIGPKLVPLGVLKWVDVRNDYGPLTYVSVLAMALAGVAALRLVPVRPAGERRGWIFCGVLYLYLALDDALTIHEAVNDWARRFVGDEYSFPWIKVLLPVFAVLGLLTLWFLVKTLRNDRPRLWEALAGYACLGAAVGFEILERLLLDSTWAPRGFPIVGYTVVAEEFLEALAPALLYLCFTRTRAAGPPTAGVTG